MSVSFATIGTSNITEYFLAALARVEGATYVGAYSRDLSRARAFGEPRGATLFFDDLDALAASPDVDAVYVASPNALHAGQAELLASAGKHVLVEKALASNACEAARVFDAARASGVVALEASRGLHVPAFGAIERMLPELGVVRSATFRFAKVSSRVARFRAGERMAIFDPHFSAGALMDIGVYCVEPAVALFGEPQEVRALATTCEVPGAAEDDPYRTIDLAGEALLGYGDKVVSIVYGKAVDDVLPCQISGEKGTLVWDTVASPSNLRLYGQGTPGMESVGGEGKATPVPAEERGFDLTAEIEDFLAAVRGEAEGLALRDRMEAVTLGSLRVMDEIRLQAGVRFPADDACGPK